MFNRTVLVSCVVSMAALTAAPAIADHDEDAVRPSIAGAWAVEMTARFDAPDCTAAAPIPFGPNPFPALHNFHKGGTVTETSSRTPPSARGPGIGVWGRVNDRTFAARWTFQEFDANGLLARTMDVRARLKLAQDGGSYTGTARLLLTDISGNTFPFCATLDANRIVL